MAGRKRQAAALQDYSALYVGDVPATWDESQIRQAHVKCGIPETALKEVRLLARKLAGETGCAIFRYADESCAAEALAVLNGMEVFTQSGQRRTLRMQYADYACPGPPGVQAASNQGTTAPRPLPAGIISAPGPQGAGTTGCSGLGVVVPPNKMARTAAPKPVTSIPAAFQKPGSWWQGSPAAAAPAGDAGGEDDSLLPSVYVSDLPGEVTEDSIRQFLHDVGVDHSLLISVKFLPPKLTANSICAMLRFPSPEILPDVVGSLKGYQITMASGEVRQIQAKVADPPKRRANISGVSAAAASASSPPDAGFSGGMGGMGSMGSMDADAGQPSLDLYVSEVPVDWTEEKFRELHLELGFDVQALQKVKMLPRRHSSYPTGSAILNYMDNITATLALQMLHGRGVGIMGPEGERQLNVRYADPPRKAASTPEPLRRVAGVAGAGGPVVPPSGLQAGSPAPDFGSWFPVANQANQNVPVAPAGCGCGVAELGAGCGAGFAGDGGGIVDDNANLPSVYVSDLPSDVDEETIRHMMRDAGLDSNMLVGVKFLKQKIQADLRSAMLRFFDHVYAEEAVRALHGYQGLLPGGVPMPKKIIAKIAQKPKIKGESVGAAVSDLYVSEVPADWTQDNLVELHRDLGVDTSTIMGIKLLERRKAEYVTGCAIIHYTDVTSASLAMQCLHGTPVPVAGGGERALGARFAEPPKKQVSVI